MEQTTLADGRIVQLGGEVIGPFHRAYVQLVEELGLTIVPSFPQLPGEDTWVLADGRYVGDDFPWMSDADRESYAALDEEFGKLAASVDPEDPWSHPDAERLDRLSMAAWLRDRGATPNVVRARDLAMLALSAESVERTSLLAELRKEAAAGGERLLQLRGLGVQPRGRGLGHGGASDGGGARPPRSATPRRSRACASRRRAAP